MQGVVHNTQFRIQIASVELTETVLNVAMPKATVMEYVHPHANALTADLNTVPMNVQKNSEP